MPIFATHSLDPTTRARLARQARAGRLRRLHEGIYTDDLLSPPEAITRREYLTIAGLLVPDGVVSHRSALEPGLTARDELFMTGPYRRRLVLPGLTLSIQKGPGPQIDDIRLPTSTGTVWRSSDYRAFLENLAQSRGAPTTRRTLGAGAVEARLERLLARDGAPALNSIRDRARSLGPILGLEAEFNRLDEIIGTLLGTREARLSDPTARARAKGHPYDSQRVLLFQALARRLALTPPIIPPARAGQDPRLAAFIESYFSNYIEGTEFELEEAREVVLEGRTIEYREDDSHDIRGTFDAIVESHRSVFPTTAESFLQQLAAWNRQVIFARAAKNPGEWKDRRNRFGDTYFVEPDLVTGTLEKGFEMIAATTDPAVRAALAMFVVAEVHPFNDGNGRTARLAMNLALSTAGFTRVIVPTVYRDDYFSALNALSHSRADEPPYPRIEPYLAMLNRAAAFSHWLDCSSVPALEAALTASNALKRPSQGKLAF
jgi:fido (protein-threonine AMPylation protein)